MPYKVTILYISILSRKRALRQAAIIKCQLCVCHFVLYSNPSVVTEPNWDSPKTREIFFRACGNCHSNETKWPAYSNVAPISWLVQNDVDHGRKDFNVSMWGVQNENEGGEAAEKVEEGEMPPWFYVILHPEAKFTENESKEFTKGLIATFGKDDENGKKHDEANEEDEDEDD